MRRVDDKPSLHCLMLDEAGKYQHNINQCHMQAVIIKSYNNFNGGGGGGGGGAGGAGGMRKRPGHKPRRYKYWAENFQMHNSCMGRGWKILCR